MMRDFWDCDRHVHSLFSRCLNGLTLHDYLNEPRRGASIAYAEVDGIAVCILGDGRWCEREQGHAGLHVLRPPDG